MNINIFKNKMIFISVFVVFILNVLIFSNFKFYGNGQIHTLFEMSCFYLASFIGLIAFVRFHSNKSKICLFNSVAFIGAALLHFFYAIITSSSFAINLQSSIDAVLNWSWLILSLFLSLFLLAGIMFTNIENSLGKVINIDKTTLFTVPLLLLSLNFIIFINIPLFNISHKFALISLILFFLAAVGYFLNNGLKKSLLEYFLILSLILNIISQIYFINSNEPFDYFFNLAYIFRILSYGYVFVGAIISIYQLYIQEKINEKERNLLENYLIDSKKQLRAILDNMPFMAWLKDKDGRFIAVNEPFAKGCNYSKEDLVGKTDLDIWPKDLAEVYKKDDFEVMNSGQQKSVEEPIETLQGRRWYETFKTPIFDKEGNVIGTTGMARDITERKQFEQELLLKDKLLVAVAEANNELVRNLDFNQAIANAFNIVGEAINVDRIVFFENKVDAENKKIITNYKHEWVSDPMFIQIDQLQSEYMPISDIPAFTETLFVNKPLISNVKDIEPIFQEKLIQQGVISITLFPIYIGDSFWGSIGFDDCKKERNWTETEKAILLTFTASLASIIERKQKRDKEKQAIAKETLLREIFENIRISLDINQIRNNIVNSIGKFFNADRCFMFGYDSGTNMFPMSSEYVSSPEIRRIIYEDIFEIASEFVLMNKSGKNNIIIDSEKFIEKNEGSFPVGVKFLRDYSIKSDYGFGIFYKNNFYGSLVIHFVKEKRNLTGDELKFLELFINQIGIALYQAELYSSLKKITEKTEAILNNIDDGVITINEKCIIQSVNPAIEKMFGYTKEELVDHHVKILFPHDPCKDCLSGGKVCLTSDLCFIKNNILKTMDYAAITKDGKTFYIESGLNEFCVEGVKTGVLMVHDVTQRKEVEKLKNEFISTVNHELRTPLTSIQGSLGLILSNAFGIIPEKANELLNIANNNTSRLINLINDILDIEKIEAGKMDFDNRIYELMPIIQQTLDENISYAAKYNVTFRVEKNIEDVKILADKNRVIQVITNLLSNAVKFSQEGTEVKVIISRLDKNIRVSIVDNGPGIPKDFRSRIFEKFSQVDSSDTKVKGGTGLGLSICKAIIEKLGGQIGFETKIGKGSVFYFDLPEYVEQSKEQVEYSGQHRVLVCEDDQDVASLIEILLKRIGCEVHIARSAQETIKLLSLNKYEAITLDLILSDVDENYMFNYLGSTEEVRNIPIIVVSVKSPQSYSDEIISKCKIIDWIEKPINHEKFICSIKTTLKINGSNKKVKNVKGIEDEV